jgi:hypothetical protein
MYARQVMPGGLFCLELRMRTESLVEVFHKNRSVQDALARRVKGEPIALLFGIDEVKLDKRRDRIRVGPFGWIPCDLALLPGKPGWVAFVMDDENPQVVLGTGNPFETGCGLPEKDGVVLAIPQILVDSDEELETAL